MHIVLDKSGIMLQEIKNEVLKLHMELALSTICKFLHSEDFPENACYSKTEG